MGFELKVNKSTAKLLDTANIGSLVPRLRQEFSKTGPKKFRRDILDDMNAGVSPVKGKRWAKYSDSYKKAINTPRIKRLATGSKLTSPVNLRLTGKLWESLSTKTTPTFFSSWRLIIAFDNFLADIHNRRGASKRKVVRRLLPTLPNEEFNRGLTNKLVSYIKLAASTVVKDFR